MSESKQKMSTLQQKWHMLWRLSIDMKKKLQDNFAGLLQVCHEPAAAFPIKITTARYKRDGHCLTCQSQHDLSVTARPAASHTPITCQSHPDHLSITARPGVNHIPITCPSHPDQLSVTSRSLVNHSPTRCQSHPHHRSVTSRSLG